MNQSIKQTIKQNIIPKQKQEVWSPFCVDQILLGMGTALVYSSYTQGSSTGENWFSQQLSVSNSFWVGLWLCFHLQFSVLGFYLAGLNLSYSSWVHVCINLLAVIHHFWLFSLALPYRSLSPKEKALMKTSWLGWSAPKSLTLCPCLTVGLCVNYHLLQEKASLMSLEWCTILWE